LNHKVTIKLQKCKYDFYVCSKFNQNMYVKKNFSFFNIIQFSGVHIIWLTIWGTVVTFFYETFHFEWLEIPWLPLSVIGTAVAFYLGFKNNSSYARLWEARKIWGAIVNSSRMWGTTVKGFVTNQFRSENLSGEELHEIHKRLFYRHIAYLYTLRSQLLVPTLWEHTSESRMAEQYTKRRKRKYGVGLFQDEITRSELNKFLKNDECEKAINYQNTATQLIDNQSQELKHLREADLIDDFRHMELQKLLNDFYTHQGQAERIKKFPLPRQYSSSSFIFVTIFIFLLPFGLAPALHDVGMTEGGPEGFGIWLTIPFTVLIGWIYIMMELVGDYSENPFEGLDNDIPMFALCRIIEIDLREMLGETDLPPKIQPVDGVLM